MYLVNLSDVQKFSDTIWFQALVKPVLGRECVEVKAKDGRLDERYWVPLDCDDERARAIISVCRMKISKNRFRFKEVGSKVCPCSEESSGS